MQRTIDQTAGSQLYVQSKHSGFFIEANKWMTTVTFPFITKNNNYSISISGITALYIGDINSGVSVYTKSNNGFVLSGTKSGMPINTHCIGDIIYTITFN